MIEIKKFTSENQHLLDAAFLIRKTVFVDEQKVDHQLEYDGLDNKAIHYLIFFRNKSVGTARRRKTKEGIKLERFAVIKEYRELSVGSQLLQFMLAELKDFQSTIYLNAQLAVEKFYEKHNFKRVGGVFIEADIEHCRMELVR